MYRVGLQQGRHNVAAAAGLFKTVVAGVLVGLCFAMLYPFWYTVVGSLMEESEFLDKILLLLPGRPTLEGYKMVFEDGTIFVHHRLARSNRDQRIRSVEVFGSTFLIYLAVFAMFIRPGLIATT